MWGLVLRPFSTCASLMSFSPFCMILVASFSSGCFFFSFLFYLLSRDPFLCVCDLFGFFWFGLKKKKNPGPYSTHLFPLLVLFSAVLWPSVFSDSVLRNLQGCILIYLFLFLRLVLRPFSL